MSRVTIFPLRNLAVEVSQLVCKIVRQIHVSQSGPDECSVIPGNVGNQCPLNSPNVREISHHYCECSTCAIALILGIILNAYIYCLLLGPYI